jgi:hypothetical protein
MRRLTKRQQQRKWSSEAYERLRKRGVYPFEIKSHRKEKGLSKLSFSEIDILLDDGKNPWDWNGARHELYGSILKKVWPQDDLYDLLYDQTLFLCK